MGSRNITNVDTGWRGRWGSCRGREGGLVWPQIALFQSGVAVPAPQCQDALQLRQLPQRHVATEPCGPPLPVGPLVSTQWFSFPWAGSFPWNLAKRTSWGKSDVRQLTREQCYYLRVAVVCICTRCVPFAIFELGNNTEIVLVSYCRLHRYLAARCLVSRTIFWLAAYLRGKLRARRCLAICKRFLSFIYLFFFIRSRCASEHQDVLLVQVGF